MKIRRRTPNSRALSAWLAWGMLAWATIPGCDNHRPLGPLHDGVAECQEIADACAGPAELGEPYLGCYDTAMAADGDACLEIYARCTQACANPGQAGAGAGGEGGVGASEAGAAGHRGGEAGAVGN